jgi:hypothetical protein
LKRRHTPPARGNRIYVAEPRKTFVVLRRRVESPQPQSWPLVTERVRYAKRLEISAISQKQPSPGR